MPDRPTTQTITSASDQRKSVPVVTVESFFNTHGEKLALRLEGPRVGFHRKIREATINRPGLVRLDLHFAGVLHHVRVGQNAFAADHSPAGCDFIRLFFCPGLARIGQAKGCEDFYNRVFDRF